MMNVRYNVAMMIAVQTQRPFQLLVNEQKNPTVLLGIQNFKGIINSISNT